MVDPKEGREPEIGSEAGLVKAFREKNFPPGTRVRMRVLEAAWRAPSSPCPQTSEMGRKGSDVGCRVAKWEKVG